MAGKREDPGQKHSTCRAHPVPAPSGARCGMTTTDDNPGDSAPAADVAVSSHSPRLGAAPPDPSSPDTGVLPWAAWAALLFWCHLLQVACMYKYLGLDCTVNRVRKKEQN